VGSGAFDVQLSRCWHDVVVNATTAGPATRIAPLLFLRIVLHPSPGAGRMVGGKLLRLNCSKKGAYMKKVFLLFVVAAFAVSPAMAATKQKKSKQAAEAEDIAKQHDNTLRALRDGLPLVLPSWSLPFYFGMHMDEKTAKADKAKK
jgi:hypothetical protein